MKYTVDILNGRLEDLEPVQFYNRLIIESKAKWTQKYKECLMKHYKNVYNWMLDWRQFNCQNCVKLETLEDVDKCYSYSSNSSSWRLNMPLCPQKDAIECHKQCLQSMYRHMEPCVPLVNEAKMNCSEKNLIGIKTIRMQFSMVEDMLKQDPEIKVIHYLRDPRGIVSSRVKSSWLQSEVSHKSWEKEISLLCRKMKDDNKYKTKIRENFPSSVLTVKYEDFAKDPTETGKQIYNHIGAPFSKELQEWLYNSTHFTEKSGDFGTVRMNGTETAYHWKKILNNDTLKKWTDICKDVLEELKY